MRTKDGIIGKVIKVLSNRVFLNSLGYAVLIKDIVKHNKIISEVVEVGDYVNGRLVLQVDYKNKNVCLLMPLTDTLANTNIMLYGYEDIKTIVTHEQMQSIEYKVEEEK